MSELLDLNKPPEEIILSYVRETNDLTDLELPIGEVELGLPVPSVVAGRNTQIRVDAKADSEFFRGYQTVHYDRLDLGLLFQENVILVTGGIEDHLTAIAKVNSEYGLAITEGELWPTEVDANGNVVITIKQSFVYLPNSSITVLDEFDFSLGTLDYLINVGLAEAAIPGD